MKFRIFPALCALLVLSCAGEMPVAPEPEQTEERQHFINYSASYGSIVVPPSESYTFRDYPHIGRAFDSVQAFFDSTMGDNDPITIFVSLGEGQYNSCRDKSTSVIACAQKGMRRIIITGRDPFDLVHGSFEWWRRVIIHETFHDLGMEGHWDPPRGTIMDSHPQSDDIHPELWKIMRREGWNVNE